MPATFLQFGEFSHPEPRPATSWTVPTDARIGARWGGDDRRQLFVALQYRIAKAVDDPKTADLAEIRAIDPAAEATRLPRVRSRRSPRRPTSQGMSR